MERYAGYTKHQIPRIANLRKCKKGDAESGKPWCLYSKSTGKLLGRHESKKSAYKQEAAIKAHGG